MIEPDEGDPGTGRWCGGGRVGHLWGGVLVVPWTALPLARSGRVKLQTDTLPVSVTWFYCGEMADAPSNPAFRGRTRERREIDRLLERVGRGESAVLVLRGEAGIGKTALLHYAARQASGCRVAHITGMESELELPFAALHQLCLPMLDGVAGLPEPQAEALRVAFGLTAGAAPDRFMVALAVLNLVCEAASKRPLAIFVDDAQWLDQPTAQVLGFIGRRLLAEPVLLLVAMRDMADSRHFSGLSALSVGGLTEGDARSLLAAVVPGHLDEQIRDRIIAETRGNPLGLIELPKSMSPSELAGGFSFPSSESIPDRLHQGYLRRVRALPPGTRHLMLLAAADPTADATLLWKAAETFDLGPDAAEPAHHEGLLHISSRVQFRHPLVRSAAYAAGTDEDRSTVHKALAEAIDADDQSERRLWHLAVATTEADEHLAAALESTASTAQARAGIAAAAAFLERSFELTSDPSRRTARGLAAANAYLQAGAFERAFTLLAKSAVPRLDDLQQARVAQLTGQLEAATSPEGEAPLHLLEAARRLESLDVRLARDTYLQAWWAAFLAARIATPGGSLVEVCAAARAAPQPTDRRAADLLLDALASVITDGRTAAVPLLRKVVDLFLTGQVSNDEWIQGGRSATSAAILLWDAESYAELSARQVSRVREAGALSQLVLALAAHTNVLTWCGDLESARTLAVEQYAAQEATGIRAAAFGPRLLAAYEGRSAELTAQDEGAADGRGGFATEIASLARAVLNNGVGRFGDALEAAREVSLFSLLQFSLPEVVESATRVGDQRAATGAFENLSEIAVTGSAWAEGAMARCRAMLSEAEAAEGAYSEAIECFSRTPLRLEMARAHLLYGEWLLTERRGLESREQLRRAYELFDAAGAEGFAGRTHTALLAAGEKMSQREVSANPELTPQEEHIARLARDGLTNPEIGAELFISSRTVEWHLRKVYWKLGISSRMELFDALPSEAGRPKITTRPQEHQPPGT